MIYMVFMAGKIMQNKQIGEAVLKALADMSTDEFMALFDASESYGVDEIVGSPSEFILAHRYQFTTPKSYKFVSATSLFSYVVEAQMTDRLLTKWVVANDTYRTFEATDNPVAGVPLAA